MNAKLHSITWVQGLEYDVTLFLRDDELTMRCTVTSVGGGIRMVQPVPDLMAVLGVSPRLITAAVLAFDAVRNPVEDPADSSLGE
jgi:hypothetical protein